MIAIFQKGMTVVKKEYCEPTITVITLLTDTNIAALQDSQTGDVLFDTDDL